MRPSLGLFVAALGLAACGGQASDATSTAPQPTSPSGTAATTTSTATSTVTSVTSTTVPVTPALGVEISAADSFDESFLSEGQPGFVPLDDPVMVPASEVTWLADDDVVMGIVHSSGEAQAYPVSQMAYHHIANTTVAGEPFLVTY